MNRIISVAAVLFLIGPVYAQQNVQVIGPVTTGDCPIFNSPTIIKDSGSSCNGGAGGFVRGPASSTSGDIAIWNNTTGTLIADPFEFNTTQDVGIQLGTAPLIPLDVGGRLHARQGTFSNGPVTAGQPLQIDLIPAGIAGVALEYENVGNSIGSPYNFGVDQGGQAIFLNIWAQSGYVSNAGVAWDGININTHVSAGTNGTSNGAVFSSYTDGTWSNTIPFGGSVALTAVANANNTSGGGDFFGGNITTTVSNGGAAVRSVTALELDVNLASATATKAGLAINDDGTSTGSTTGAYGITGFSTTSASIVTIGTGTKTFTVSSGLSIFPNSQLVRIDNVASPSTSYMVGTVTSYSGTTLTVNVSYVFLLASGTFSSWKIYDAIPANFGVFIQAPAGAAGFQYGLALVGQEGGAPGVSTSGTLIYGGGGTAAKGVDLTQMTFTGNAFSSPGYVVDQIGDIAVASTLNSTGVGSGSIVTGGGLSVALDTSLGGKLLRTNIVAPSTPASGLTQEYVDSTDKRLHDKNDAGTIGTTVVANSGAANEVITGISSAGGISLGFVSGALVGIQKYTATGTYTRTANVTTAIVECVGGGGSGGGSGSMVSNVSAGGGGGGGGYCRKLATPGATETVTIGGGGAAPSAGNNAGNAGGASTFGTTPVCTAGGGAAGAAGGESTQVNSAGGAGGIGTVGDLLGSGSPGGMSVANFSAGLLMAGNGGSSLYGGGGAYGGAGGVAGQNYGGGGSGGGTYSNGSTTAGGVGAGGICFVYEYR